MSDGLIEFGIGETRAVVLADGVIVEVHVERDGGWRAGDVREVRLTAILQPGVRGIVAVGGVEALLEPLPRILTEGVSLRVKVVREALVEAGRVRLAKVVATSDPVRPGSGLAERMRERGFSLHEINAHGPDRLEQAGWTEAIEDAIAGRITFAGGSLTISPTPGMTVIDVDGALPPLELALAAAHAVGAAIRRFDLTGSIGIDFPTVDDKAARTAIGSRLDAALPAPFERTAVNGFGFAQIVRPRIRPSVIEVLRANPASTAALRLLRQAERSGEPGARVLTAAPAVVAWLESCSALLSELARRTGTLVKLQADACLAISAGYVAPGP